MSQLNFFDYLDTLERSEAKIEAKRQDVRECGDSWYTDAFKYLDNEDYLADNVTSRAYNAFRSNPPSTKPYVDQVRLLGGDGCHDVPLRVFVDLFSRAMRQSGRKIMTDLQRAVFDAYNEATDMGLPHGQYIAEKVGISRNAAYFHISKIKTKLTLRYGSQPDIMSVAKSIKRTLARDCAMCGTPTPNPRYDLCWNCHERFDNKKDFYPYSIHEVNMYRRNAERDHMARAKELALKQVYR